MAYKRVRLGPPPKQGLYDPRFEHDACGVGFVADIKGRKSHRILQQAIQVLRNLDHRGACGCEVNTGDGAGVLLQMPHEFLLEACNKVRIALPDPGQYGCGLVFLPRNPTKRRKLEEQLGHIVQSTGLTLLGWRTVPTDNTTLGETARASEPFVRQVFIGRGPQIKTEMDFERALYVVRKRGYSEIRTSTIDGAEYWYVASLSCKTIVYKGMLLTEQLPRYFPDLQNPAMITALALVHSRFSTNTFPSWDRAHPYRYIAHNGEINTLRGNINWIKAREALFESELFGEQMRAILPVVNPNGSDSAMFDNTLELLVLAGRSLPHAVMMMIPEPWSAHESMDDSTTRVLPVSLLPDGALGWPGLNCVHRWPADRRGARSQWLAALALLRHQGRFRGDGVRSRGARFSARADRAQGASAARAHVPGRYRAGSHH